MPKHKTKTLSYRRAVWLEGSDKTLETYLREAIKKKKTVSSRSFGKPGDQIVKGLVVRPLRAGGVILHITAETPGDPASVLSIAQDDNDNGTVSTAPAPVGTEFMDGDAFAYCRDDDVCICSSILRDASITWFCFEFFRSANLGENSIKFDLQKVADASKLAIIQNDGVKEIELGAGLYEATTTYQARKDKLSGALGTVGRHISALFGSDKHPRPDNLQVAVVLKADGRIKDGRVLGYRRINQLARSLIDGKEDYVIVTRKNQRITNDSISIKRVVEIEAHGKSVNSNAAWKALAEFYAELIESGIKAS